MTITNINTNNFIPSHEDTKYLVRVDDHFFVSTLKNGLYFDDAVHKTIFQVWEVDELAILS